ncbi:flagellar assembly protein FliW [Cellulomonas sp. SLBN-39]|uniref:flagellar assembly protein FliW n=1 Tax=Cellulomonas sp. SLBN-39 TaxID=2768446 RepID=UPI001151F666|nr:flagellar assembly protein FliW [Cellulomonas sp. SLBN-39]TQL01650.1 flagellar assembly factor FliW [Cellulomonas sp. SLBN-39]
MSVGVGTTVRVATPQGDRDVPSVLHLAAELPGLPGRTEYALEPIEDSGTLFSLRSAPGGAHPVRLFVAAPHAFFPEYAPRIGQDLLADAMRAEDAGGTGSGATLLLVVVHPAGDDRDQHTANLLAPILVDPARGLAQQVVLDEDLPLRAPIG